LQSVHDQLKEGPAVLSAAELETLHVTFEREKHNVAQKEAILTALLSPYLAAGGMVLSNTEKSWQAQSSRRMLRTHGLKKLNKEGRSMMESPEISLLRMYSVLAVSPTSVDKQSLQAVLRSVAIPFLFQN